MQLGACQGHFRMLASGTSLTVYYIVTLNINISFKFGNLTIT